MKMTSSDLNFKNRERERERERMRARESGPEEGGCVCMRHIKQIVGQWLFKAYNIDNWFMNESIFISQIGESR